MDTPRATPNISVIAIGPPEATTVLASAWVGLAPITLIGHVEAAEAFKRVSQEVPDILLMWATPEVLPVARDLGRLAPGSRMIAVCEPAQKARATSSQLIDAGFGTVIHGPIDLDGAASKWAAVIWRVAHGESFLDAALAQEVLERHQQNLSRLALTASEQEVLVRLAAGDDVSVIAANHSISSRIVRLHAAAATTRLLFT